MKPIFIGGCDRSGTTLLGAMLGAHPRHVTVPEMPFKVEIIASRSFRLPEVIRDLEAQFRFRIWDIDMNASVAQSDSPRQLIEEIVSAYANKVGKTESNVFVDHTPSNLKFAGKLLESFPDAQFVHIVRDGRAVAASLLRVDWGPNDIARAAHYWAEQLAFGFAAELSLTTRRVTRVRYEDLVARPDQVIRELCTTLQLPYSKQMQEASGFVAPAYTVPIHKLVGSAPVGTRINAWRDQLGSREVEIFESIAGELLTYLGYTPQFGATAVPASSSERVRANARHLVRSRANKLRSVARRRLALYRLRRAVT